MTADGTDSKAKAAARPLGLSVRGTGGEHTPIGVDGTVDISPSNRLFITEAEIITKLYNGIKLLLQKESDALTGPLDCSDMSAVIDRAFLVNKRYPDNRCVKYLLELKEDGTLDGMDPEDLAKLIKCAKTGLENFDSGLGCYAMEPADYDRFAFFFDRVCNDYHKNPEGDKIHSTNWSLEGAEGLPEDGVLDIEKLGLTTPLSMRVRVGRNLTSFPLPGKVHCAFEATVCVAKGACVFLGAMTKADRINFEKTMLAAFDLLIANPEYGGTVNSLTPNEDWMEVTGDEANPNLISPERYQELVDAHVMFKDMDADPFLKSAGISGDWPCGRGCYQSADGGFIIWFGEEDQLRIMLVRTAPLTRFVACSTS